MSKEECLELLKDPVIDRCLGAMFGAFIGDALGSYCEF
jgi:ADP-ribosyl-[dinitrogen reductase] hydrolase